MGCHKLIALFLTTLAVCGCVAAPEVDWRMRRDVLDMRPSEKPGVVGSVTVAGNVDAYTFTEGNLWIVIAAPTRRSIPINRLAKIGLFSNRFVDLYAVDGFAKASLANGYGSIWLAEGLGGKTLHRVDPNTGQIIASIEFPHNPISVVTGEGGVWVLAADRINKIGKILIGVKGWALYKVEPDSNTITDKISLPLELLPSRPEEDARMYFWGNSIWISIGDGPVVRVDPQTNKILALFADPKEAIAREPGYGLVSSKEKQMAEQATTIVGSPVYAVASGMGTRWAFTHGNRADGDNPRITWIMRLDP